MQVKNANIIFNRDSDFLLWKLQFRTALDIKKGNKFEGGKIF